MTDTVSYTPEEIKTRNELTLRISPEKALATTLSIVGMLSLLGILIPSYPFWFGRESYALELIAARFDLGGEANLPTYFAALQLLACAVLLGIIAIQHNRARSHWRFHWAVLCLGFAFLSFDEAAQFHELLNVPTRYWLTDRVDGAVWVLPALAVLLPVSFAFIPFLFSLPFRIAALFVSAAVLFLSGAAGIETLSSDLDKSSLAYFSWVVVEEMLELIGVSLFLFALLKLFAIEHRSLRVTVQH